ncbi:MAG: DUF362 domain-containing protein [Candidatus Hydrogenedentota bacterium]
MLLLDIIRVTTFFRGDDMSKVYFINMRANMKKTSLKRLRELVLKSNFDEILEKNDITAVKVHFGEKGNVAYLRPIYVREIIDMIKEKGARPFLTDVNTIYKGSRSDAIVHLQTAIENGFNYASMNVPIIIADGLKGEAKIDKHFNNLKHYKVIEIPEAIYYADSLIVLSHFKLHEVTGFGGALKNVGMGLATKRGKLSMHSTVAPYVKDKKCIGCKLCIKWCPMNAIEFINGRSTINSEKCIGCGQCLGTCPEAAISLKWDASSSVLQERMMEQCYAMLQNKKAKVLFVNFCIDIVPECDCYGYSDAKILPDLGIFASTDPVAIDKACVDMVLKSIPLEKTETVLKERAKNSDVFRWVYPEIDYNVQFEYACKLGLGSLKYELIKLSL